MTGMPAESRVAGPYQSKSPALHTRPSNRFWRDWRTVTSESGKAAEMRRTPVRFASYRVHSNFAKRVECGGFHRVLFCPFSDRFGIPSELRPLRSPLSDSPALVPAADAFRGA